MHPQKKIMAWLNVLGGVAVLGSYAHGFATHPDTSSQLWGGVPEPIRPFYGLWMFVAAAGYLTFTYFLFFRVDPDRARVAGRFSFGLFNLLYAAILIPSALWMPLTFELLAGWSAGLWWLIRLLLWVIGLASLALIIALARLRPNQPPRLYRLAVVASIAFTVQTGLLDALVWVAYYP